MDIGFVGAVLQHVVAQAPDQAAEAVQGISGADLRMVAKCLGAAFCMGIGALGSGLSEGLAAMKACEGVARNPEATPLITRTMIVGQAVTESVAIYALVVAALILFAVK
ncbi:MAG: F-type H+-transporting ATPase subunit c [Candidatus Hydrogenedentes bacterium]|nr:F-type H+-transporting ATPase subunit c [Candidatus Hydrogenedentota bacterium]